MQKQFYLRLTKAKASKTKPKTGKAERKREPVPVFRSASYLKTMMSKIRKGESNRADLYAKIAEPHPIFGKDSTNHIQNKQVLSEHGLIFAKLTSTFLLKQLISDSSDNRNSVRNNSCKGNVTNRLKNTPLPSPKRVRTSSPETRRWPCNSSCPTPRARVGIFRKGGIFRRKKNRRHCAVAVYPAANPIATARTSRRNGIRRSPPERTGLWTK